MKPELEAFRKALRSTTLCRATDRSAPSFVHGTSRAFASGRNSDAGESREEEGGSCWDKKSMYLEGGANAYEVLGVSSSCSQEHLREAFTKLAKLTHPDLQPGSSTPAQFILILSAYRILSSSTKRAQYDAYLQACRERIKGPHGIERTIMVDHVKKDGEVVEWLRWYRRTTMNMVYEREIGTSGRFHDKFRANLQEAMRRAYFGPDIDNDGVLYPSCFEAEERAELAEMDVLHLVSGQQCFGAVRQVCPTALLEESSPKLEPSNYSQCLQNSLPSLRKTYHMSYFDKLQHTHEITNSQERFMGNHAQSAFVDLELYLYGNLVARASRVDSKTTTDGQAANAKVLDEITVYLCPYECSKTGSKTPELMLGTIVGLNMTESGGKGAVYSSHGEQTHIIWQFRTPWVKHVHWFKINAKRLLCECKLSRARLPSSKYWLFEPRSERHDIGGWYIEMLFRGQRGLQGAGAASKWGGKQLGLLHPAMYIFGTAYKTLDTETIKEKEKSTSSVFGYQETLIVAAAVRLLQWCKCKLLTLRSYRVMRGL